MRDLCDLSRGGSEMNREAFLASGQEVLEWMADYLTGKEEHPLSSQSPPGTLIRSLPKEPPWQPEPFASILDDFRTLVVPNSTHWTSSRFMGYFGLGPCAVSLLGWMLPRGVCNQEQQPRSDRSSPTPDDEMRHGDDHGQDQQEMDQGPGDAQEQSAKPEHQQYARDGQ